MRALSDSMRSCVTSGPRPSLHQKSLRVSSYSRFIFLQSAALSLVRFAAGHKLESDQVLRDFEARASVRVRGAGECRAVSSEEELKSGRGTRDDFRPLAGADGP